MIDRSALRTLWSADLPSPIDVPNLLTFRDREQYGWYAVTVAPLLRIVGASVRWAGGHVEAVHGEAFAEELLIVRYASHQRFLALALNPYYALINRFRVRGVERFYASFTHPSLTARSLGKAECLLVAHLPDVAAREALEAALADRGGTLVYATQRIRDLDFISGRSRANPRPIPHDVIAFFELGDLDRTRTAVDEQVITAAGEASSLQIYRRLPLGEMLPAPVQHLRGFMGQATGITR